MEDLQAKIDELNELRGEIEGLRYTLRNRTIKLAESLRNVTVAEAYAMGLVKFNLPIDGVDDEVDVFKALY